MSQLILREGLRAMIEGDNVFRCEDEGTVAEADVTVIDLSDLSSLERVRFSPEDYPKLVVLAEPLGPKELGELVNSGARAVVAKTADSRTLLNALRLVANGGKWLDPQVTAQSRSQELFESAQRHYWNSLTVREKQVATLMIEGHRPDGISMKLGISIHTVGNHSRQLFRKLHINTRLELARYWSYNNEVDAPRRSASNSEQEFDCATRTDRPCTKHHGVIFPSG